MNRILSWREGVHGLSEICHGSKWKDFTFGLRDELLIYATREPLQILGLCLIGTAKEKAGVMSFVLEGHRKEKVGAAPNRDGIALRSGHHCAQPALQRFAQETTAYPSLALYNSCDDVDRIMAALRRIKR